MRRLIWFLVVVAAVVAVGLFVWRGDPVRPRGTNALDAPTRHDSAAPATVVNDGASADAAPTPFALRGAVAPELTAYELLLAATATGFTGRVVAANGEPVPGIGTSLLRISADAALTFDLDVFARVPATPRLVVAETVTDREGRFVLTGVAPRGLLALRLAFADAAAAPARFRGGQGTFVPVQKTPAPGGVVDLGDIRLKTGATLFGRVVGLDGPVAGACVRAARLPPLPFAAVPLERLRPDGVLIGTPGGQPIVVEFPEWVARLFDTLPIAVTFTANDGSFVLYGVDPGAVVVAATKDRLVSCLRQGVDCSAGQAQSLGDLFLAEGSTAEVLVVDREGQPIAGAEVIVAPMSVGIPAHIGERIGRTGANGKLTIDGLPRGRALAAARRMNDDHWHVGEPGSADGLLRVELPSRHSLTLAVTDPVGQMLRHVEIRLVAGALAQGALEMALFGMNAPAELSHRPESQGDGRLVLRDLAAGPWTLAIGAPGFATQTLEVDLAGDAERSVMLRPARSLRVRTIGADGEPVVDATLHVRSRGGSRAERIVELPLAVGRTDGDGWCAVPDLPTDKTVLTAIHPRHGQVHAVVDGRPAELVMQFAAASSVRGVLTDGGRAPAPGRWVAVLERRYDGEKDPRGAMPDLPQLAMPDLAGRFEFAALQPGNYRISAQDSFAEVSTVAGIFEYTAKQKQIFPWNKAEVVLRGGDTAEVRLDAIVDAAAYDGPGAAVRGTVRVDGAPATGALVVGTSQKPDRRITSRVDAGGAFDFGHVPVGELRVVVVPADVADSRLKENLFSHLYARNLEVVPEQPIQLDIVIDTGSAYGEVRDDQGAAVADCRVMLYDRGDGERSSSLRMTRTDRRGAFSFTGVPGGTYEVRAEVEAGKASVGNVAVVVGGAAGPIVLQLTRLAKVTGRVVFDMAVLPERATLRLRPIGGGEDLRTNVELATGRFEIRAAPVGRYRAELRVPGADRPMGEIEVVLPETIDVVLRPGAN